MHCLPARQSTILSIGCVEILGESGLDIGETTRLVAGALPRLPASNHSRGGYLGVYLPIQHQCLLETCTRRFVVGAREGNHRETMDATRFAQHTTHAPIERQRLLE